MWHKIFQFFLLIRKNEKVSNYLSEVKKGISPFILIKLNLKLYRLYIFTLAPLPHHYLRNNHGKDFRHGGLVFIHSDGKADCWGNILYKVVL